MSDQESIPLTSSELGYLWTGYSINEMSKWYLKIFRGQAKDQEIKNLYSFAIQKTTELLKTRKEILLREGYPISVGFSEMDIDRSSPPLFSDRFILSYLHGGSRLGLDFHSRAFSLATRVDVRKYLLDCVNFSLQLHENVVNLLLHKGLYLRTPSLPAPTSQETIQKNSYLSGWFGDSRPMNSMEIANHYL